MSVKAIFEEARSYWLDVKDHCDDLVNDFELFEDNNWQTQAYKMQFLNSGLSWLTMGHVLGKVLEVTARAFSTTTMAMRTIPKTQAEADLIVQDWRPFRGQLVAGFNMPRIREIV